MFIKKSNIILIFLFLFSFNFIFSGIDLLKGTYSILKDQYKNLSILNGVIADESDFVMRLYDYGAMKEKEITKDGNQYKVPDFSNASHTVKLVNIFYHRIPGTRSKSDFILTEKLMQLDAKTVVEKLAGMIIKIYKINNEIKNEIKLLENKKGAFIKKGEKQTDVSLRFKGEKILGSMQPIYEALFEEHDIYASKKTLEPKQKAVYAANTTLNILLSVVYRFCGQDKNLYKIFYEKLNSNIDEESIFNDNALPENWVNEQFNPKDLEIYKDRISNLDLKNTLTNLEEITYVAFMPGKFPSISRIKEAYFSYDPKNVNKKVSCQDCGENVIRNLVNILCYDPKNKNFDLEILKNRIKRNSTESFEVSLNEKLLEFYNKFEQATDIESQDARNSWMKVISNIPFVSYIHILSVKRGRQEEKGYIYIPTEVGQDYFVEKGYFLAKKDDVLYEVKGSLRNIIVLLNYLLGLNLFKNEEGDSNNEKIASALRRDDFIKNYFPLLCQRLGIEFEWEHLSSDTVDKKDFTTEKIYTKLKFDKKSIKYDFELITYGIHGHGELRKLYGEQNQYTEHQVLSWLKRDTIFADKDLRPLQNLSCFLFEEEIIPFFKNMSPVSIFNLIFDMNIQNSNLISQLIHDFLQNKIIINNNIYKLLVYLVNTIPDANIQRQCKLNLMEIKLNSYKDSFEKGQDFDAAIVEARKNIQSKDKNIRDIGFALLELILKKDQGLNKAIKLGIKIKNENFTVFLLKFLLERTEKMFDQWCAPASSEKNKKNICLSISKAQDKIKKINLARNKFIAYQDAEEAWKSVRRQCTEYKYIEEDERFKELIKLADKIILILTNQRESLQPEYERKWDTYNKEISEKGKLSRERSDKRTTTYKKLSTKEFNKLNQVIWNLTQEAKENKPLRVDIPKNSSLYIKLQALSEGFLDLGAISKGDLLDLDAETLQELIEKYEK